MTQAEDYEQKAISYQQLTTASYEIARRYMRFGPRIKAIEWQQRARDDWKVFEHYLNAAMLARKQGR